MPFPNLRVRTGYSYKDAYGRIPDVIEQLKWIGCDSAAIVDWGTWGHSRFEQAADAAGIKAMFGMECPIILDYSSFKPKAWILARDIKKFYNITSRIVQNRGLTPEEFGALEGVVRFPGGALNVLSPEMYDYIDINPSSFVHAHEGMIASRETCKPIVITGYNDMPSKDHESFAHAWEVRDSVGLRHVTDEGEIWKVLRHVMKLNEFDIGLYNTGFVAANLSDTKLLKAPLIHLQGDLVALAREGQCSRLARGHIKEWTAEYEDRFQFEINQIQAKDFDSYFLVVADLVTYAKKHMLVGPARGSSAGSLVCYLVGITEVDPIPYGLLFQRFIDVVRTDLPDIDIDFSDVKRHLVFEYLQNKYGKDQVARLGNINTLKAASVMAHVGKRFNIPINETFQVRNAMIEYASGDARYGKGLQDTFDDTTPGRSFKERFPEAARCMGDLELHPSHSSVHAAGILVGNEKITNFCTVNEEGVAQLDKKDAEYLNLLKIDALGLRTLGIIEDCGVVTADELYSLELNDQSVLDILNEDKVSGIFQFEGDAVRSVTRSVHVDEFKKINHLTALARPGPLASGMAQRYIARAAGREPIKYDVPQLESYLSKTYGVFLFQEQIMYIAKNIGQLDWKKVAVLRKAMSGSKGEEWFNQLGEEFIAGAMAQGIEEEIATKIWKSMVTFGSWGFNECISGDTKVQLAHPNHVDPHDPTIEYLYNRYILNPSNWIRQNGTMPILLCYDEEKKAAFPVMAKDIVCNGSKDCIELTFDDGSKIKCTKDHKFIIDGEWKTCGEATVGSKFLRTRKYIQEYESKSENGKGWAKGMEWGKYGTKGNPDMEKNGKTRDLNQFIDRMHNQPCEDCGKAMKRMEAHHNDFAGGDIRPKDLSWLCSGCHKKRHYDSGRNVQYGKGQQLGDPAILVSIEAVGKIVTYDIVMPDPWHNYILENKIVTHNSHSHSYAVVTYWTMWLKRYHKLEFAAACLRSATGNEQTIAILRELAKEGVEYTALDPEYSDMNWKVADGRLIGGIQNAVGYGPVKALKYIQKRNEGSLTDKDRATLAKAKVLYADLAEAHTLWGHFYREPKLAGVTSGNPIVGMTSVKDRDECLVIGKLTKKILADENEAIRIKKRGGTVWKGETAFLDLMMVDDSTDTPMRFRIRPNMYQQFGKDIAETAPAGSWWLVRGWKIQGIDMFIVKNIKELKQS